MTTTVPPAHSEVAASLDWETATLGQIWRASDLAGVTACSVLRALDKLEGADPESVSERVKH